MVTGGTGAAMRHGSVETSNSVMARTLLHPAVTCCQNRSRPTPNGETTPIPEMTTPRPRSVRMATYNNMARVSVLSPLIRRAT